VPRVACPLPQHHTVLLESWGTGWDTAASCSPEPIRDGAEHAASPNQPAPIGEPSATSPRAEQSRNGLSSHPRGQCQAGEVACQEGTTRMSWEVGESSKVQGEHAGTGESRLVRQREGGGEEEGIINRKFSIPQHLRDRGIAVIRPRGRKLAGLRERKPRLEETAEESEMEDCYCIQASGGQREGGEEKGRKRSTRGEPGDRAEERRACEDQTAGLPQGTSVLLAVLQDEGSCPTCSREGWSSIRGLVTARRRPASPQPTSPRPAPQPLPVARAGHQHAGLSQRPGLRAPASGRLGGATQQAGQGKGPALPSQGICSSRRGAESKNGGRRLAGANPGPVLLHPTAGPGTCHLLLWNGSPSPRPSHPTRTYLSKADPWLWLLVRREKTLRSLRGRVGGDEGGVKPTSGGLSREG